MVVNEKDLQIIFKSPLFVGVQKNHALRVFDLFNCEIRALEKGEEILSPETREKQAGLILEGKARVTTADNAKKSILRELSQKDVFGIANLFSNASFVTNIRAVSPCRILFLPELAVRNLLENDRAFLYNYLGFLSSRIRFLNQKICYFTAGSAERRLALYLLSFKSQKVCIDLPLSALAELLDLGRASLYRAFDALEVAGYIEKKGRTIKLLCPKELKVAYQS